MKAAVFMVLLIAQAGFAQEKKEKPAQTPPRPAITVKDAKKACKEAGKEGADLLKCIKEKTGYL